ncbi:MAG TPA: CoA-binding protein [Kofleriaceae bacterium]|nr:CoA-binding protein [Kofleriaceae bacterium]
MGARVATWEVRQGTGTRSGKATAAKIAATVMFGAGGLAAILGVAIAITANRQVLGAHELLGDVSVLALWALAFIAARSGVSKPGAWAAAGAGLVVFAFVGLQRMALGPTGHLISQVLHVASSVGMLAIGGVLARAAMRRERAPGSVTQPKLAEAAHAFLGNRRIAVTGVSRTASSGHGANVVYRRLRERGYAVYAVNPNAESVEGDRAYPDLRSIPGGVDAVVIATRPAHAIETMRECAELGIGYAWMHRGVGGTSVSPEATAWGRAHGIAVIDGGCPLMFAPVADPAHKAMRFALSLGGRLPRQVPARA